ncbi:tyrosine-type recombinase/integrase [Halalkalibacter urbisdiaboli]|uniref:tyrosine-type recombinase/integrase n=1 Tax=Halalkalibacter urbisdiaboli TaxID=1960589 RepID=UPI0013FE3197|nr:tyrosine-type recombinase/integrase [Halalkalibacter urbisdiaboli]
MNNKCAGSTDSIKEILDNFSAYLSSKGRAENTIKTYCGVIHSFLVWLHERNRSFISITNQDIQSYLSFLEEEKRNAATINKVYNSIHTYAKSVNRLDLMKDVEKTKVETHKGLPECLTDKEIETLLTNVKKDKNKRNIALVYTLLYTGVRVSELCQLNKGDLQINQRSQTGQLLVRNDKAEYERTIPLSKELVLQIKQYLDSRTDDEEALFISNYEKRIAARTVQHMLKKQYNIHPHKLRHTFCYNLVKKGIDLSVVSQLAGHSDINITKQYEELPEDIVS